MHQVHTVGYEGASLDDFIVTLKRAGVKMVLDIRQLPQSRRRGFSKNQLSTALVGAGLAYRHVRQLGDPKPGRDAARRGDYVEFRRIFDEHLSSEASRSALNEAAELVMAVPTALLCYERDPKCCHRSIVATHLADRVPISIIHLGVAPQPRRLGESDGEAAGRDARAR